MAGAHWQGDQVSPPKRRYEVHNVNARNDQGRAPLDCNDNLVAYANPPQKNAGLDDLLCLDGSRGVGLILGRPVRISSLQEA